MKAKKKLAELKYHEDNDTDSDDEDDELVPSDPTNQNDRSSSSKSPPRSGNVGLLALRAATRFSAHRINQFL